MFKLDKNSIVGNVYGNLTVLRQVPHAKRYHYECLCSCGNLKVVSKSNLTTNHTRSCGCLAIQSRHDNFKDIAGKAFGRLTAIKPIAIKNKSILWECQCSCGNTCSITLSNLSTGHTKSCGCLALETKTKHGMSHHRLTSIYGGMVQRCTNPKCTKYASYGDRGITVCSEWLQQNTKFFDWALANGYKDNLTIDRRDNNKGYSPENCRWVNTSTQNRNRRKKSNLTSKYKNISLTKHNTWLVQLRVEGTRYSLGCFKTEEEAHTAKLNFIKENNIKR